MPIYSMLFELSETREYPSNRNCSGSSRRSESSNLSLVVLDESGRIVCPLYISLTNVLFLFTMTTSPAGLAITLEVVPKLYTVCSAF